MAADGFIVIRERNFGSIYLEYQISKELFKEMGLIV
jgi:hypothetical protein